MTDQAVAAHRRILVVDDTEAIHQDFRAVLDGAPGEDPPMQAAKAAILGDATPVRQRQPFEIDSAFGGREALEMVQAARAQSRPYAMAFIDVRMPPGWDGIETLHRIWQHDPLIQAVICTAFSDYSWDDMVDRFGDTDRLLLLRKPFDNMEVRQLAAALTRKWQLEHESRLKLAQLQQAVAHGTRDIARARDELLVMNQQLEAARVAAENANQAKSGVLANISHEIRTPMTAILGYADLLLEEGHIQRATADQLHALHAIRRNGNHLLQLLNDILDISKIEANKLSVERVACSPLVIVDDVMASLWGRAGQKQLSLTREIAGAIPREIRTDPMRLRQILVNLLSNAVKFTDSGGVRVVMRMAEPAAGGPRLLLEVIDTGIGMSPQQIAGVFEPFAQADIATARHHGGTGLGLAISRRLASLLGGQLTVSSQPGHGSTFRVTVETGALDGVAMLPSDQIDAAPMRPDPAAKPRVRLQGRVLLAEDGPDNQRLFAHLLERAGAEVTVVADGQQVCREVNAAVAGNRPYDLLLVDVQMPVLDGYDTVRRLRQEGCQLPIIALTAHAMTGDREKCLQAGCSDYLAKPIAPHAFLAAVAKHASAQPAAPVA